MCLSAAVGRPFAVSDQTLRVARLIATGVAVAVAGLVGFAVAHAFLIVPIWTQLLGGVPFVLVAGVALAWAFDELVRVRGSQSLASGVQFGALMFVTMLPATAFEAALRLTGVRGDLLEVAAAVTLAVGSGATAGWLLTRQRRASLAFAVATLMLTLASAGPLPVAQSARGVWLSLAIAPICLVSGAVLAAVRARLVSQDTL